MQYKGSFRYYVITTLGGGAGGACQIMTIDDSSKGSLDIMDTRSVQEETRTHSLPYRRVLHD